MAKLMSDLDLRTRQLQGQTMPDLGNSSEARIMPMLEEYGRDVVSGRRFNKTMKDFSGRMNEVTRLMGEQPLSQIDQNEQFSTIMPNILDVAGMGAMVAGKLAKTADLDMLKIAKDATKKGMSKEKVFDATGWFKGKDGQWRFEIDDTGSGLTKAGLKDLQDYGWANQGDIYKHPSLYDEYPGTDYISTRNTRDLGGAYKPDVDEIELSGRSVRDAISRKKIAGDAMDEVSSTNAHELQHAIQHREGLATGGSPVQFQIAKENAEYMISGYNARMHDVVKRMDELKASPRYYSDTGKKEYKEMKGAYDRLMDLRSSYVKPAQADPYDSYRALAGEVEARNVQKRLMFDPDQRRMLAPWKTEDTDLKKQIVRFK